MRLLLLPLTLAAADERTPPDGEVLIERATAGVRSPPGCWKMTGEGADAWNAGLFGKGRRTWALTGTLDGGVWTELAATVTGGEPAEEGQDRGSLFGRNPKWEEGGEKRAERVSILEVLRDDVTIETVEPADGGWRLLRSLKGGDAGRNLLDLRFDAALRPFWWSIVIVDPVKLKTDKGTQGRIVKMDARLEASPGGAPRRESIVATFAKWPFSVDIDSTTTWRAERCAAEADPAPAEVPIPDTPELPNGAAP